MTPSGSATTFFICDLEHSLRFYTEVLGFAESFRFGDYAGVHWGEVQIHLSGPGSTNRKQEGQGSIYLFCKGVDAYYEQVRTKGAKIQAPPRNHEYGMRDFVIEDPDGNLIGIGEEISHQA